MPVSRFQNRAAPRSAALIVPVAGLLLAIASWVSPAADVPPVAGAAPVVPEAREKDARARVAAALESIRGMTIDGLSPDEHNDLARRLDATWKVLLENEAIARPAVRGALAAENDDGFRIIELAYLQMVLDPDGGPEAAVAMLRTAPAVYPDGWFHAVSLMPASGCGACLQASVRMLELGELRSSLPRQGATVDLRLGLTFALGRFGEAAMQPARARLASDECIVRANAALMLGDLLPVEVPAELREMAFGDPCVRAREGAWVALGMLDPPQLTELTRQRLTSDDAPSALERGAIVTALASSFAPEARRLLEAISSDDDPEVARQAVRAFKEQLRGTPSPAELSRIAGSAPASSRRRMQRLLDKVVRRGRFVYAGEFNDFLARLTPEDLPLLNVARAAVLDRLSDEALGEYLRLNYAARALRATRPAP